MANEFITRKGIKSLGGITFPHKKYHQIIL